MLRIASVILIATGLGAAKGGAAEVTLGQERLGNVFVRPESVTISVTAPSEAADWVLFDHDGEPVRAGELPLEDGRARLVLPDLSPGYYELEVTVSDLQAEDDTRRTSLALLEPRGPVDRRFGVMTHFAQGWSPDVVPLISMAGLGHVRDELYWKQVERARGEFDFPSRYTRYMTALQRYDIEPSIVLSFANDLYDDGLSPFTDGGRAAFARYARTVVERFPDQIAAVEVWNEYNGSFCEGPCEDDRAGYYTPMLEAAYAALKDARPEVTVAGGAAVTVALPYLEEVFAKGGLASMDAVVVHPYGSTPESAAREIAELNAVIERYAGGREVPVWVTEFGEGGPDESRRGETARFLVRMTVSLLSKGVERIGWYLLQDDREFVGMGLLRHPDGPFGRFAPAPAYVAYAQLIRRLAGSAFVQREETDGRMHVYRFAGPEGEVRVAWSPHDEAVLELHGGDLTRVDLMGRSRRLEATDGTARLTVGPDPVYILGAVDRITDHWPDRLVADSLRDYGDRQGGSGWFYGHYDGDGDGEGTVAAPYADGDFERMERVVDRWSHKWGDRRFGWLSLGARSAHPSKTSDGPVWSVRRWVSDRSGTLRIRVRATASSGKGDGTSLVMLVDGETLSETGLGGRTNRTRIDDQIEIVVKEGTTVDFALSPGPEGDMHYDATSFEAQIVETGTP